MAKQETGPSKELPKQETPQFLIEKNGSLRLNPKWIDEHPEYQQEIDREKALKELKKQEGLKYREEKLKIPDSIKPRTGEMLFRTTERQIMINKEAMEKDEHSMVLRDATRKLESLRDMYTKVKRKARGKIWDGQRSTEENAEEALNNMSALEMCDYVDEYIQEMEELGKHDPKTYNHFIKIAEDLKIRLLDEANRLGPEK